MSSYAFSSGLDCHICAVASSLQDSEYNTTCRETGFPASLSLRFMMCASESSHARSDVLALAGCLGECANMAERFAQHAPQLPGKPAMKAWRRHLMKHESHLIVLGEGGRLACWGCTAASTGRQACIKERTRPTGTPSRAASASGRGKAGAGAKTGALRPSDTAW